MEHLRQRLRGLHRKSYKLYKELKGTYRFPRFALDVDYVQGDPFATPSRVCIRVARDVAGIPRDLWQTSVRRRAMEDFLGRAASRAIRAVVRGGRGTGHSGEMDIQTSGQQVLRRNAVVIGAEHVEARILMGLPADGRRINARAAEPMFFEELPEVVRRSLVFDNLDTEAARRHVRSVEDQSALRDALDERGLVAFVADGAVLPRCSGIDDRPMARGAVTFRAPNTLAHTIELPTAGPVRGLGIPRGVTLIVGGGFHGKSTLLHALERGVYDHIPGDGRERVAADPTAMKVRAEDGRAISSVNISPFIDRLPFGRDTQRFSTENASGSTSQAANIVEALETGSRVLLVDEDTSATNFMIRDARMQQLVAREKEPITPFLHRVRELYERHGISTVLVMGGSGDYFEVADTVIMMDTYEPRDVTERARALCPGASPGRAESALPALAIGSRRRPGARTMDPSRGKHPVKIDVKRRDALGYGQHAIDLSSVEQLVDIGQTRAIGWMMQYYARHCVDNGAALVENLRELYAVAEREGLDAFVPYRMGELALPRLQELAAAINRIREGEWDG